MWTVQPLNPAAYREHLDVAFPADAQRAFVSETDKVAILVLYELYERTLGRPSTELVGEHMDQAVQQAVHDAYELVQDGRRLGDLRAALKLLTSSCPYCGFGPIEDLDHFLQRGRFRPFSIFALNLIPSCATCNRGKRKRPSVDPSEHQIHPYLEDLSSFDFLRAQVGIDAQSGGLQVRYFIERCEGMSEDLYRRLVHHLETFGLQREDYSRYSQPINIYLGSFKYPITSSYESGGSQGLKRFLEGTAEANSKHKEFGPNDWRTALMRALSQCPAFYEGGFETALGLRSIADQQVQAQKQATGIQGP